MGRRTMKQHTVKQVARLSGISVRTLHFYDEIGLLKPAYYGANGYRYYEKEQLLSLQQILFYRELNVPLEQIKLIMARFRPPRDTESTSNSAGERARAVPTADPDHRWHDRRTQRNQDDGK